MARGAGQTASRLGVRHFLLASTAVLGSAPAEAADWLGTTSPNWFAPGNWSTSAVPTSSTDVNINNAASPNPATVSTAGAVARAVDIGTSAGQSGTLNIDGGTLTSTGSFAVGNSGSGTLNISNGGVLNSGASNIAWNAGGATGTATVTGAGSTWNASSLNIGTDVNAVGQLNVLNGGKVAVGSGGMYLGYAGTGASGTVLVSGNGSSLTSSGAVNLGYGGTGTITVTGAGASFSSGQFNIGYNVFGGVSGDGIFNLQNGATATSGSVNIGYLSAATSGTANISGAGTNWTTGNIRIGLPGTAIMTISDGAKVQSYGEATGGTAFVRDRVVVTGAGSQWLIGGTSATGAYDTLALGIGNSTRASTLSVEDGGNVTIRSTATGTNGGDASLRVGTVATQAATLNVTGNGSSVTTPYDVYVGYANNSNGIVTVSNGGTLNTGFTSVASAAGSTGSVTVTGANSIWNVSDSQNSGPSQGIFLGLTGAAASLTISNGGVVNVNSSDGTVNVGTNSSLNIGAAAADAAAAAGTLTANNVALGGGGSTLNFNHTSTNYVFAPSITDTGTVSFLSGTTILSGNNTYSGTTTIASGATAQFGNGGTWGLIAGDVTDNGAMIVKLSSSRVYAGVISGSGSLEQQGQGTNQTLTLTNTNTYTGGTTISSGTLQLGDGGSTGSVAGNIVNNSHLSLYRSDNFTFSKLVSGTGDLDKTGSGTMTLAAAQTYTGGTSVSQGTLRLGASNRLVSTGSLFIFGGATFDLGGFSQTVGAFSGPGTAAIGTGSLTVGNSLDRNFQGNLTGSGSFIKQGTGSLTMSGDSSTYTGSTTVSDGALIVTGNLSNSATVANSGGTLGGTGTVGATTVNGTIAPGLAGAIGTLNVNGDYIQAASSFYDVHVNAAGASDRVNVIGVGHAADLQGGTVRVTAGAGSYATNTQYTILSAAGGVTNAFSGVTSNFAFLDPSLTYDVNNVYLTLDRNSIDFASVGLTPNQIAAGRGLESLGIADPMVNAVLTLSPDQARAAFDSASGEIHPSLHSPMLGESALVRDALLGRQRLDATQGSAGTVATSFAEEDDGAMAYARKARRARSGPKWPVKAPPPAIGPVFGAWVQGYGNWTRLNGDGNAATLRSTNGGAIGGVDVTLNHTWRFGVAAGGGRTDARADARLSSGTIDTFHIAAYGGGRMGDIMFRTGASYSHHDISTVRTIAFPGFADTATASYGGATSQVFGEAAYRLHQSWLTAEAFGNLAYVHVRSDGFVESGGAAALAVAEAKTAVTFTTLGFHAQAPIPALGPWLMTARGSLGWQHAYGDVTPISLMSFASGSVPFAIAGVPIATDVLLVEAGLDARISGNAVLALLYTGRIASDASAHALRANLAVRF